MSVNILFRSIVKPVLLWGLLFCMLPLKLSAQETPPPPPSIIAPDTAPVVVDGVQLFVISGISVYPAKERANLTRSAIIEAARTTGLEGSDIVIIEFADRTQLLAGDILFISVLDSDARQEGLSRETLADIYRRQISKTIDRYRADRRPERLALSFAFALGYLLALALLVWGVNRLFHWLEARAERDLKRNFEDIEHRSQKLVNAGRLWLLLATLFRALRLGLLVLLVYLAATRILELFPWTRSLAGQLLNLFIVPLRELWHGLVQATPGLIFILVLFLIFRYLLNLMKVLFHSVESGRIRLVNFDPDWAMPTFKIARVVLIAFGIIIAYPYIPGSDSLAFKGVSVFVGVLLSIGSSSVISNTFAGLSMIYRRAFKVGDRVRIGDVQGKVREIRLQTTQIVTPKNVSVVLPNSNIMNANVINYSHLAKEEGLVLHTTVDIGYDTSWRQVESMLLTAADRTDGVLKDPPPYVLRKKLGDFAIDYEVNAYCSTADRMQRLYSSLHDNILDVFNEHNVQIMSPAYVADPDQSKVVPPDQWQQISPTTGDDANRA